MSYPPGSDAATFEREVENDFEVEHYHGRYYYEGPAVRVEDDDQFVDVIRLTTVRLTWDQVGLGGRIVYPRHGSKEVEA